MEAAGIEPASRETSTNTSTMCSQAMLVSEETGASLAAAPLDSLGSSLARIFISPGASRAGHRTNPHCDGTWRRHGRPPPVPGYLFLGGQLKIFICN